MSIATSVYQAMVNRYVIPVIERAQGGGPSRGPCGGPYRRPCRGARRVAGVEPPPHRGGEAGTEIRRVAAGRVAAPDPEMPPRVRFVRSATSRALHHALPISRVHWKSIQCLVQHASTYSRTSTPAGMFHSVARARIIGSVSGRRRPSTSEAQGCEPISVEISFWRNLRAYTTCSIAETGSRGSISQCSPS